MEKICDNLHSKSRSLQILMTSCEEVHMNEFLRIVSRTDKLHKFANTLTSNLEVFLKIIKDEVGLKRVMRILGISDDINTIIFFPIMMRFSEIMTHEHGYDLASRVLNVCNIYQKDIFFHMTYRRGLVLARDENGCIVLKKVITIANDLFKGDFLDLIADHAHSLSADELGISLIQHVLKLDFTHKTTQDDTRLHELMAEFDEILSTSDIAELHKLALKLTSDADLFVEFVKTRRGSLMVQIILGKSEEIDTVFLAAIKQRFTDVTANFYGYRILLRTIKAFRNRGNDKVYHQIQRLIGVHAPYLAKDPDMGNLVVQHAINLQLVETTIIIACGLQCHYIELSFLKYGSNIVEKLLDDGKTAMPLLFVVMEIVKCDEDTLVRLAKDEYGNNVLKKTLEVAKECWVHTKERATALLTKGSMTGVLKFGLSLRCRLSTLDLVQINSVNSKILLSLDSASYSYLHVFTSFQRNRHRFDNTLVAMAYLVGR